MDPLSISASIVALLQVSGNVINLISTITSSSAEIRCLAVEISTTRALLSSIADIAEVNETWNENLRRLTVEDGPMQMLDALLSKLERRLNQEVRVKSDLRQLRKKLSWPWRVEETRQMVNTARETRGLLAGALAVDHFAISKEIQKQTKQIHENSQKSSLRQDLSEQRMVLEWLSSVNAADSHYAARAKHEPETGDWLLASESFSHWLAGTKELLWLYGIPGSGKTGVLCSTIIEHVQNICSSDEGPVSFCIYYYFDFKDRRRQNLDGFIRSALAQFCQQNTTIPREVMDLYTDRGRKGRDPTLASLVETLLMLLKQSENTYIVLDALDESREQKEVLQLISRIKEGYGYSANILITSRMERQIQTGLQYLSTWEICLHGPQVHRDIQTLVNRVLVTDPVLSKRPVQLKKEIEQALVNGASGMFRWVACQLDALRPCLSPSALRKTLRSLPQTLDETYERVLCGIDEEVRFVAFTALQFLTVSSRPVNLDELSEMVAIKSGVSIFIEIDRLFDPTDLLSVCSSLVTISRVSWVQLSHYSVREFLMSERIRKGAASYFAIHEPEAHLAIAQRCLTYILSFDQPVIPGHLHSSSSSLTSSLDESLAMAYPLLKYAAVEWHSHVRFLPSEYQTRIKSMIFRLLDQENVPFHRWLSIYRLGEEETSHGSPLYYAAELGLSCIVQALLETGADVNSVGGMYGSALSGATLGGHEDIVRVLLEHGADVNIRGGHFDTPLQAACVNRNVEVFNLLLAHGADINIIGGYYGCALQAAAARGWPEGALVLIESGADVNITAGQFGTSLQAASRYGHMELVIELLARGSNPNATSGYYNTALQAAARGGHSEIIQILLEHGADVHIEGGFCGNALNAAHSRHNHAVVEILEAQLALSDQGRSLA